MNKIQAKVLNIVGKCLKENPSEPCIVDCIIRWKGGDIVRDLVSVGNLGWLTKDQFDEVDNDTTFAFEDLNSMARCTTQLDFDFNDYDNNGDVYAQEVEKYGDSEEDEQFYFGTPEDFCIVDILDAFPTSEY